jgi:hypothetical protein
LTLKMMKTAFGLNTTPNTVSYSQQPSPPNAAILLQTNRRKP